MENVGWVGIGLGTSMTNVDMWIIQVSPWEGAPRGPASRVLPLCFRGKPAARERAERTRVVPRDERHG